MSNTQKPSSTGTAKIVRSGHTASKNYGSDPMISGVGAPAPVKDLKIK